MSRSVLVTGGNRGIGLAIAQAFAEAGDKVAITYRSGEPPQALTELGVLAVRCDITDSEQVEQAYKQIEDAHGAVEVLVANAGITKDTLLMRMSEEDFTSVLDTNLTGTFRVVKRANRGMLRAKKGRVVLISSVVGLLGSAGQANYAASKAALVGFARYLARDLGKENIRCNLVSAGPIGSMAAKSIPGFGELAEVWNTRSMLDWDMSDPEPTGKGVVALLSDWFPKTTGEIVHVDGGLHAMGA
ncbi:SDR family oxidoreductase [Streptomyces cadmiisoli]|uniref:SDR family oxidoreductase n=1 Tax=Streptomyces cadmiisoli TaxID=2184053 RepID=UPI00364E2E07